MALRFEREQLPDGVLHVLIDDGTDVTHIFAEYARWDHVARAAAQGSTVYAQWRRVSGSAPEAAAR